MSFHMVDWYNWAAKYLGEGFRKRFGFPYGLMHRADLHRVLLQACRASGRVSLRTHLDGAPLTSATIAPGKARTAALGSRESKVYEDIINNGRYSFLSAPGIESLLEGGVPIMAGGDCVGAVGVSGVKSNEDAQIAKAGIAALGI